MTPAETIDMLAQKAYQTAADKGFWDDHRSTIHSLALVHAEVSEAVEAVRNGYPDDDKLVGCDAFTAELADIIIRVLDIAGESELPLGEVLCRKMHYNRSRPYKHGKTA